MAKVTISEASKMVGLTRQHMYRKYVNTGLLSCNIENNIKVIDVTELIRVFDKVTPLEQIDSKQVTIDDSIAPSVNNDVIDLLKEQITALKEQVKELQGDKADLTTSNSWLQAELTKALTRTDTLLLENKEVTKKKKWGLF